MKRLKKTCKYEKFINDWFNSCGSVSDNEIDNIISENPQFKYSGSGYRWLQLPDIKKIIFENVKYNENDDNYLEYIDIVNLIKKYIKNDNNYYSWSQYFDGAVTYAEKQMEEFGRGDFGVIISSNVKGLDYCEFLNYYDPNMSEIANEEAETIAKSNGDYIIEEITILKNGVMYEYCNENPCTIIYDNNSIEIN